MNAIYTIDWTCPCLRKNSGQDNLEDSQPPIIDAFCIEDSIFRSDGVTRAFLIIYSIILFPDLGYKTSPTIQTVKNIETKT